MRHRACKRVNENQPGQRDSKHVKVESGSDDDWVWDLEMHTFVKKQRFGPLLKNKGLVLC